MKDINWHGFEVVETIDFNDGEESSPESLFFLFIPGILFFFK